MCNIINNHFRSCGHSQYQNTFQCQKARGSELRLENLTLNKTKLLPDYSMLPPDYTATGKESKHCIERKLCRPKDGYCDACKRHKVKTTVFGEDMHVIGQSKLTFLPLYRCPPQGELFNFPLS